MEKRIVLELRGEERSQCTSLDLSECKTGGEWEVWHHHHGVEDDNNVDIGAGAGVVRFPHLLLTFMAVWEHDYSSAGVDRR